MIVSTRELTLSLQEFKMAGPRTATIGQKTSGKKNQATALRVIQTAKVMEQLAFIIDDHQDTRLALCELLEANGFACKEYESFDEAIDVIPRDHPCFVLVDFHTRSSVSIESLVANVKRENPEVWIAIMSGDPRARVAADKMGTLFLLKPIEPDQMLEICERFCRHRAQSLQGN
ncbi:MAG TPA: response regulator [Planctomycetota bacterium]|nr:response regulator [Planctomycetota bacterium]